MGRVANAVGGARQRIGDGEGSVGELEEDGGAFRPEVVEFFQQAVGEVDLHVAEVDLVGCPRRLEGDERLSAAGAAADEGVAAAGGQENVGGRNAAFVCGAGNGDIAREPGDGTAVVETAGGCPCAKMDAGEGTAVEAAQVDGSRLTGQFDRDSACGSVVRSSGQDTACNRKGSSSNILIIQFKSTARDGNMGCAEAGSVDKFETAFFQRDLAGDGIAAVAEDEGASPLLGQEAGAVQDSAQGHSLSVAEADESSVLARARKGHSMGSCPARAACGRGESSIAQNDRAIRAAENVGCRGGGGVAQRQRTAGEGKAGVGVDGDGPIDGKFSVGKQLEFGSVGKDQTGGRHRAGKSQGFVGRRRTDGADGEGVGLQRTAEGIPFVEEVQNESTGGFFKGTRHAGELPGEGNRSLRSGVVK